MNDTSPAAVIAMIDLLERPYGNLTGGEKQDAAKMIAALSAQLEAANQRAAASVEAVARANAERDGAIIAKERFQRMTRAHWEALCAMRNSINEYIPMPNTDSGPLLSPEDGPIYADIAERVISEIRKMKCEKQQEPATCADTLGLLGSDALARAVEDSTERDALVAAAYAAAAQTAERSEVYQNHVTVGRIRALTPAHATAALDRIKADARDAALVEASLKIANTNEVNKTRMERLILALRTQAPEPARVTVQDAAAICVGCGKPANGRCWTDCGMSFCGAPICNDCHHVDQANGWTHEPRAIAGGRNE